MFDARVVGRPSVASYPSVNVSAGRPPAAGNLMVARVPSTRQLSLFGVEARPPTPLDLEGLLAGAGQVVRMGGTARVSVLVDAAWRARALLTECALRELVASVEPGLVEGTLAFRTAYSTALAPLGTAWLRGA